MFYFAGDGRRPAHAAFGWWLADWGPSAPPPPPPPTLHAAAEDWSDGEDSARGRTPEDLWPLSVSDQSEAEPTWSCVHEEADSGLGSTETSLGPAHSPSPRRSPSPSPLSLPRRLALLRFLRVLRAPECEHTEEQLRAVEQQRATRARLDGLRADTRALLNDAKRLRAQMQACEAHAQSVSGGARRLSEEVRETRHLDAVLRWLRGPLPDVALAALPDDTGATIPGALRRYRSEGDIAALRRSDAIRTLNYRLLPNDFEETYLDVEARSPACTGTRLVLLSTDYETPYLDVEARTSALRSSQTPSSHLRRDVDRCEEGLRLLLTTHDEDNEDSDDARTEDEWSLLSDASEDERRDTTEIPTPQVSSRSPGVGVASGRRPSMQSALRARFRDRGFPEDARAATPSLYRGYSV